MGKIHIIEIVTNKIAPISDFGSGNNIMINLYGYSWLVGGEHGD